MKNSWFSAFYVFVSLIIGFTIPTTVASAEDIPPATCANGNAYLESGALGLAENTYKAVLKVNPKADCALLGLRKVAEQRCRVAEKKAKAGDPEGAGDIYTTVLEAYPDLQCAIAGLSTLPSGYDEVEKLVKINDYSEAWTSLKAAVKANPTDSKLQTLRTQLWARWQSGILWMKYYLTPIFAVLLSIAVVVVALGRLRRRRKLRLDVVEFDPGMVTLKETPSENSQPGPLLIAQFEEELTRIGGEGYKLRRPDLIDAPLEPPDFPADFQIIPKEVDAFWSFITKLIPANIVEIKGTLKYLPERGAGLYLKLVNSRTNRLWGAFTVWQSEVDPGYGPDPGGPNIDDYLELVEFTAISAYWEVLRHKGRNVRRVFGTDSARSYFITTRQVSPLMEELIDTSLQQKERKEKRTEIETLCRQALSYDHLNYTAQFYMGRATMDIDLIKAVKSKIKPKNPVRITANYLLGTRETMQYIRKSNETEKKVHLANARQFFKEAVKHAEKNKRRLRPEASDDYIAMLKIPYAAVHYWSDTRWPPWFNPAEMIEKIDREYHTSGKVLYNLACHYSTACMFNLLPDDALNKALQCLKNSLRDMPGLVGYVTNDPTLDYLCKNKKKEVEELVDKYTIPPPQSPKPSAPKPPIKPVGLTDLVGSENAARLKTLNIESADDFKRETLTRKNRKILAEKCFINEALLRHWAKAVEMILVRGIEIGQVVLFDAVGIASLEQLGAWRENDIAELHDMLEKTAQNRFPEISPPDIETVAGWITTAKHIQTQVERGDTQCLETL